MNQVKESTIELPEAASSQAAGIQEIRFPEPPDFEQLAQQTAKTVVRVLSGNCGEIPRCVYVNPVILVTAEYATEEFFRVVRKRQGEWCRRYKQVFGRGSTRRTRDWLPDGGGSQSKAARYHERAYAFTGVLLIEGRPFPSREWPKSSPERKENSTVESPCS